MGGISKAKRSGKPNWTFSPPISERPHKSGTTLVLDWRNLCLKMNEAVHCGTGAARDHHWAENTANIGFAHVQHFVAWLERGSSP